MARIHDLFIVELAEVIKGYGNDPDVEDPFRLSEFYRFYELPNIAVSRENFEKMRPVKSERKPGRWKEHIFEGIMGGRPRALMCNQCNSLSLHATNFCPNCGADMRPQKGVTDV